VSTRRSWWIALLLSTLAVPLGARAQDDFGRTGPYLGLAGNYSIFTTPSDLLPGGDVDDPLGLNARVGYRFHPHLAIEAQVEWLARADVDVDFFGNLGKLDVITTTANAKAYFLTGRVQPFLLAGAGALVAVSDPNGGDGDANTGFAGRFAIGTDIYITRNILAAFDVSYVLPTMDPSGADYVSFGWGLGYRF
jgi:hypothetical protein